MVPQSTDGLSIILDQNVTIGGTSKSSSPSSVWISFEIVNKYIHTVSQACRPFSFPDHN